jgi:hypothetical protein
VTILVTICSLCSAISLPRRPQVLALIGRKGMSVLGGPEESSAEGGGPSNREGQSDLFVLAPPDPNKLNR